MGIFSLLFFLPTGKQGRAREGAAAALAGRPRHGGGREGGGKEEGRTGNGFPSSILEEGPRREGSHGDGRRSALGGAAAALQGLAVAGARGKRKRATVGPFSLTHHGLGCSGVC